MGNLLVSTSKKIIDHANPHTVKKFELIEKYVRTWAQKLLQNQYCDGIVFIDCMSNSGEYIDDDGKQIFGTPVRVAKYLREAAGQYYGKQIDLYFNDLAKEKTEHLASLMPKESGNFHCHISTGDGNELAKKLGQSIDANKHKHYLLIYDPYQATIDWNSILPYLNNWCEIIINHMVSDSIRAVKMVKKDEARSKYEQTYLTELENLIPYGSDKTAYENRIKDIIKTLRKNNSRKYYIAAFPFFNEKNAIVYNLIHCTSNLKGFQLYKKSAWQTFGGKSSTKNTHGKEHQIMLDFDGKGFFTTATDEFCYYIKDIAEYLQDVFDGQSNVPFNKLWEVLDEHPIFPSDGYRNDIKNELKNNFNAIFTRSNVSFVHRGVAK